ncbi:MmcQ/YjbR family DNA-binding protein [bacterium]|nr:MmcQ/YjbR family DNA-binding protein [bacterium]
MKNLFKGYSVDINKLKNYGFSQDKNLYYLEKDFYENAFKAIIVIDSDGGMTSKVYDNETKDEYLLLNVESKAGGFAQEIKSAYEEILLEIRDKCFIKNDFILPQTNRISSLITEIYGDKPEFLWPKYSDCGIFRNPASKKWYAGILDTDYKNLNPKLSGFIEVINLKIDHKKIPELCKSKGIYPAYHMNKKYWISITLDEKVSDRLIMEYVSESYEFSQK